MSNATANIDSMDEPELTRQKTISEIVHMNIETRKFAEEALKLARERWWHGAISVVAIVGATVSATLIGLRVFGLI